MEEAEDVLNIEDEEIYVKQLYKVSFTFFSNNESSSGIN